MKKRLEVLTVEDSEDDAQLLAREFRKGGLDAEFTRVDTHEALCSALRARDWDLVLCDYSMPHYNGMAALHAIRELAPDLPVIFVSGTIGEELAVEAMRAGANDYLMKGNLKRLVPAVERELRDTEVRVARKQSQEDLKRMNERLSLATNAARLGVWDWDIPKNKLIWDDRMYALYGLEREDFPSTYEAWLKAVHPDDRAHNDEISKLARRGEQQYDTEFRVVWPDGSIHFLKAYGQIVRDADGQTVRMTGVNFDITERKLMEDQLRQAHKMEAIGQLAGGVAHDFNNIVAAIMMHLETMQANLNLDASTRAGLEELKTAAMLASRVTRQLLMFSRRSIWSAQRLNLNEVVDNLLNMLHRLLGESIQIVFDKQEDLSPIEADAGMMEQMVMNLCVNARDAMPHGGQITMATAMADIGEHEASVHPDRRQGRFTRFSVTDTGCGMSARTIERIFEPFFTTKEVGKGTGLGLATVYEIVKQHQGWIEVASELGKGSVFQVFLPAHAGAAAKKPDSATADSLPRGCETILLVEDEATLRTGVARFLQMLGYRVIEAVSGTDALSLWPRHQPQVDMLLTDMVMPEGLTGLELARQLRKEKPGLRVILCSGHSEEINDRGALAADDILFLSKPITSFTMAMAVRDCLDRR